MNKALGQAEIMDNRRHILQHANGNILEIGIGTGLNLSVYPSSITEITAIDPLLREIPSAPILVKLYPDAAEQMHFENNTFDTVVSTFTFCSVKDLNITLREISRVLKPNGRLLFLEHGKAEKKFVQKMQDVVNPLYTVFACGCNINRNYQQVLSEAGFRIINYNLYRAKIFPKFLAGYLYEGVAINEKFENYL